MTAASLPAASDAAPFGTFALPPARERLRALVAHLPSGRWQRQAASVLRRVVLAGWPDPVDFEPFPTTRARLYPRDNISDKHCLMHPEVWDAIERGAILEHLRTAVSQPLVFVDVGANVGLYTLSALSKARTHGRDLRVLAVEPEPLNLARLRFNLLCSEAGESVTVAAMAAGDRHCTARLQVAQRNRGDTYISPDGDVEVEMAPLADLVINAGFDHIDAMKLDIEGYEPIVLEHFFAHVPAALYPAIIVVEVRYDPTQRVAAICAAAGYKTLRDDGFNAILNYNAAIRN